MIGPRRAGFGDGQRDAFAELEFPHARRQRGSGFERDGRRHDAHVRIFFEQQLQDLAHLPAGAAEEEELTLEQAAQRAFALTSEGFSASAAAKAAAQGTAYSKSEVYKQLLLLQQAAE